MAIQRKGAREGVRKEDGLPDWATLEESEQWLREATGQTWALPRILKHGVWPSVWIDYTGREPAEVFDRMFNGRAEGFLAPFCFKGDIHRLAVARGEALLTMTRSPRGELLRMTPGIPAPLSELRFPGEKLRALAVRSPGGPTLKRVALVKRNSRLWPSIEADLSEASRNGLSVARITGRPGYWNEARAVAWATERDKLVGTMPNTLSSTMHRIRG